MTLKELTLLVEGELVGDGEVTISNLDSIDKAGPSDITFLVKIKELGRLRESKAACALVPLDVDRDPGMPIIKVRDPYLASAIIHNKLLYKDFVAKGIHPRAYIGENCQVAENVTIEPLVAVGDNVKIGERVTLEAGVVLGEGVVIGDDCLLKANVTVNEECIIGNRVIIHSGTVIGSDGYGYATDQMGNHVKRPQVGRVKIDDDVEIGANSCVDRGAFGDTWIQSGVKIDNQVQVAHNVVVGVNSLLVAQSAISGSSTLGRNVVLGGRAALTGHIHLEDQVMVAAGSGVHNSQPKGAVLGGSPAIPIKTWGKATAVFAKLPEIYRDFRRLKKDVAQLQETGQEKGDKE